MAQRRGPGRPMGLGPEINQSSSLPIPLEAVDSAIRDILTGRELAAWESLPLASKNLFIDRLRTGLFEVAGEAFADPNQIYIGEYGDVAGVQVTFKVDEFLKNPVAYLKKLPDEYIKGILRYQDVEREVEMRVVRGVTNATTSKLSSLSSNGGDLHLVENKGEIGRDGIEDYKKYNSEILNWVNLSQQAGKRENQRNKVVDTTHYIVMKEYINAHSPGGGLNNKDPDVARQFNTVLSTAPVEDKALFTGYKDTEPFKKTIKSDIIGGYSLEEMLNPTLTTASIPNFDHAYTKGKYLDSILGERLGQSDPMKEFFAELKRDPTRYGFRSTVSVENLTKAISGQKLGDARGKVLSALVFHPPSDVTRAEVERLRYILERVEKTASTARGHMRDFYESKFKYHAQEYIDDLLDTSVLSPAEKARAKNRILTAIDWKYYVDTRTLMESQQEFFTAVGKGDIWKRYFFGGRYSQYTPAFIQDINNKILATKVPGTSYRLSDIQAGVRSTFIERPLQYIGFAGSEMTQKGILKGLLSVPKHAYLRENEFDPKLKTKIEGLGQIGARRGDIILFESGKTHDNFKEVEKKFRNNLLHLKTPELMLFARNFESLPTVLEAVDYMASDFLSRLPLNASLSGLHSDFAELYRTRDYNSVFVTIAGTPQFDRYKDALEMIFGKFSELESKGVDPDDFLSTALYLAKNENFIGNFDSKAYVLNRYLPLLPALAQHLSEVQNYLFEFVGEKIIGNKIFKIPGIKPVYDFFYNPKFGALSWATKIVGWADKAKIAPFLGKILHSPFISKILPFALQGVTSGTAYLAVLLSKAGIAVAKGLWGAIRGDFGRFFRELGKAWNDVVIEPFKFLAKIYVYIGIALFVTVYMFILFFTGGGVLSQKYREVATDNIALLNQNLPIITNPDGSSCVIRGDANGTPLIGRIGSPFGSSTTYPVSSCPGWRSFKGRQNFHAGVDMATGGKNPPIVNPFNGDAYVSFAGWNAAGYGNLVILQVEAEGNTYTMYFAHLYSIAVSQGQTVSSGDVLGLVGTTGNSTGEHLHWEIRQGSYALLNPCHINPSVCKGSCSTDDLGNRICTN